MKLITAIFSPHRLSDVKNALMAAGIGNMTAFNALGCGREGSQKEVYRGVEHEIQLAGRVYLVIVLNEDDVEVAIEAIQKGVKTGGGNHGVIFVQTLDDFIRISTGERGSQAL
ncbi:MAG: P-II family nitrogen regulator [Parcubacteria group bacterium]|nr:P-II family nitrogen regulator [Parcubacteria group bacterium]